MLIGVDIPTCAPPRNTVVFLGTTLFLLYLSVRRYFLVRAQKPNIEVSLVLLSLVGFIISSLSYIALSVRPLLYIMMMSVLSTFLTSRFNINTPTHVEIDIHFVRDKVVLGQVRILHVPSLYMFADIFTKTYRDNYLHISNQVLAYDLLPL